MTDLAVPTAAPRTPVKGSRRRAVGRPPWLLLLAALVTTLVATAPLWFLLVEASSVGWARVAEILGRPGLLESLRNSLALALVVGALTMLFGTLGAWLVIRTRVFGRRTWTVLLVLPLAVPSYVAAYAWVSLWPGFSGFWAAVLVLTMSTMPYVVLPVVAALRQGESGVEEMARSLGANSMRTTLTVTLPSVWPAMLAGGLLAMLYTLSEFGSVAILRVDVLTRDIYLSFASAFDRTTAVIQSLTLVGLALILVLAEGRMRGSVARWRVACGAARPISLARLPSWGNGLALALLAGLAALGLVIPLVALLQRLVQGIRGGFDLTELVTAAGATAGVALLGAVLATLLALPVALLAARFPGKRTRLVEAASFAGHALPGVVVGLSLVFLTLKVFPSLYQTLATVALAYAVLFLPKAIGSARSTLERVPPSLEQVARSQGRNGFGAFVSVTAPIAGPGLAAGGLLVMVTAMKELPATLMLRPTGLDTLATEMWSRTEVAAYGAAAPYALALVLVASIPAALLARSVVRGKVTT